MSVEYVIRMREGGPAAVMPARKWPPVGDPCRWHIRMGSIGFHIHVLVQVGAVEVVPAPDGMTSEEAARVMSTGWPKGPNGEVASFRLSSSDGWLISPEESRQLGEKLTAWLASEPKLDFEGATYDLAKSSRGRDDKEVRIMFEDMARFFMFAAEHDGFVVR